MIICFGQEVKTQTPRYKFKIYFEDAVGRIDSVRFVYDSSIDIIADRERFGYKDITRLPFDEKFEVRGADIGGQDNHSKIFADYYSKSRCIAGKPQMNSINIRATDFPVRMVWDNEYFEGDDCLDWSRFTRSINFALHPWNDPLVYYRMSDFSEFIITKDWLLQTEDYRNIYLHDIQGGGKDPIFVIFIGISSEFDGTVSTKDEQKGVLKIYPNPVHQTIRFSANEVTSPMDYEILSLNGNTIKSGKINPSFYAIEVSDMEAGVYFIRVIEGRSQKIIKFIKL